METETVAAPDVGRRCRLQVLAVWSDLGFTSTRNVLRHLRKLITLSTATILLFFCKIHPILHGADFKELEHVPLICNQNDDKESEDIHLDSRTCSWCVEPLANYAYFSLGCGFNLHKKCAEIPLKINLMWHRKHPLVLQFNSEHFSCKICPNPDRLVYCCSLCEFVVHIECIPTPPNVIEDKGHEHTFTLFWRRSSFICDACGVEGNYFAYICSICSIMVHKKCISLPRIIKSKWHDHPISHTYFLQEEDFKSLDCMSCHESVNPEHGGYSCSDCNIVFHVNCVAKDKDSYFVILQEEEDGKSSKSLELLPEVSIDSITGVIERNNAGEATKIKHFKHAHNLTISDKISECEKCCDGCMLPVSTSFYHCSECDFFLHKACAEFPKMKHVWHHSCRQPLILVSDNVLRCNNCCYLSNGYAYKCDECGKHICLRCVIALTPGALTCQGHQHSLLYFEHYKGLCNACGVDTQGALFCKVCTFALNIICFSLPTTARDKCDEHLLALTYHDDNNYWKCHYCDIFEERRDPSHWFYHCATCDTSAHINCVLGQYPFIKLGRIYEQVFHQHPLTFVKKIYDYPDCLECGEPCEDLALECAKSGCNYIVHWKGVAPFDLQ
ncbi:hypothetical protein PTKIN_Ptkin17bG0037000 [Pterospermum kingtungense]